jgi:predicted RNA-binding Zn-ribbon protein involved in translation (DUF1610 family)
VKKDQPKHHVHLDSRQRLPCPACGFRIIDARLQNKSELHVMRKGDLWDGDYFVKCFSCKAEIGIRKIE